MDQTPGPGENSSTSPESAPLLESFAAAVDAPQAVANWGLDQTPRTIQPVPTKLLALTFALLALLVIPFVFLALRSDTGAPASKEDDAYTTLEAYVRATADGLSLDTELSDTQRAALTAARRLERKEGAFLTLQGPSGCWSVPLTPTDRTTAPERVDVMFCG